MPSSKARRGSTTVELIIALPILFLVVYVFVQLGLLMATTERLIAASQQGARTAARGGSEEDVREVVRDLLGPARFEKAEVEASLTNPESGMPWQTGEPVEVLVRMPAKDAIPIPLLFGRDEELQGKTVMRKE